MCPIHGNHSNCLAWNSIFLSCDQTPRHNYKLPPIPFSLENGIIHLENDWLDLSVWEASSSGCPAVLYRDWLGWWHWSSLSGPWEALFYKIHHLFPVSARNLISSWVSCSRVHGFLISSTCVCSCTPASSVTVTWCQPLHSAYFIVSLAQL